MAQVVERQTPDVANPACRDRGMQGGIVDNNSCVLDRRAQAAAFFRPDWLAREVRVTTAITPAAITG
mgnify:FL=1|jgi:hypothetical protein